MSSTPTNTIIIEEGGTSGFVAIAKVPRFFGSGMPDFVSISVDEAIAAGAIENSLQTGSTSVVVVSGPDGVPNGTETGDERP